MIRVLAVLALAMFVSGSAVPSLAQKTLADIRARGELICGAHSDLAGFGIRDSNGQWSGLDVDYCRALAAAIFDDPAKVRFVPLTASERFNALASAQIDVLIRNTTWTMGRDGGMKFNFPAINYYDGQGFMVRRQMNISSALELNGASICTQSGTTSELNVEDFFRANKMRYEAKSFPTSADTVKAYSEGKCEAFSADASALFAERLRLEKPEDHVVLPEIISKEPLGSVVRHGDDQWLDIVKWTHFAMLNAEELGVTQGNLETALKSDNPEIRRLLGREGDFGEQIGLTKDWAVRIIRHVGNYGEVFERNVGQGSRLKIGRGVNALWSRGGLQYAPPIR